MKYLYPNIFKRKSFHLFRDNKTKYYYKKDYHIENEELDNIYNYFNQVKPLIADIKVAIKIVKEEETNCKRGAEYCILLYSEKKPNYLQNIGYIGEQLDLYLVNLDIGTLWYGIGRTEELEYNGLDFVTMIAICKVPPSSFRKDMFKSKRKSIEEIYAGSNYQDVINIARFAPSSCNTQPWFIKDKGNNSIDVYRYKKEGKRGIMPSDRIVYQNLIDIGIFIFFLTLIFLDKGNNFNLILYNDDVSNNQEYTIDASFIIE